MSRFYPHVRSRGSNSGNSALARGRMQPPRQPSHHALTTHSNPARSDTEMAVKFRDRRIFRPDNFWRTQVSPLDSAVTKNTYLQISPRTDLPNYPPPGTSRARNLTQPHITKPSQRSYPSHWIQGQLPDQRGHSAQSFGPTPRVLVHMPLCVGAVVGPSRGSGRPK